MRNATGKFFQDREFGREDGKRLTKKEGRSKNEVKYLLKNLAMKILYFDTETTGLMKGGPLSEQPHIVQLGAILSEATMDGFEDSEIDMLFNP